MKTTGSEGHGPKLWDECTEDEQKRLRQLMDDMIPYYGRISVYDVDTAFIHEHQDACMRLALAARRVVLQHTELTPDKAIFSDELFGQLLAEAWQTLFTQDDRVFFNANLQHAAECFRMGIMMADLPQM